MAEPMFTATADVLLRVGLAALLGSPVALVVTLMVLARSPLGNGQHAAVDQPVQFDHRHHVRDDGIDCRYCHDAVDTRATAGIPPTSRCMGCHAQVWNDSPKLEPVRASFFDDRSIAWTRVTKLPDFVFFNHSIHVAKGVGCVECHGRVDRMAVVEQVAPLAMRWCLDCHRNPAPRQRPVEAVTDMAWTPREAIAAAIPKAHPRTECTTCHR